MNNCFKSVLISLLMVSISGCELIGQSRTTSTDEKSAPVVTIDSPPKIITTDWKTIITPLTNELFATTSITDNNKLLISDIKNNTNQYVSSTQINNIILILFNNQNMFQVIDKQTINTAKQNLGIPYDDSLVSRGKMLALARNIKADYLLFTTIQQVPAQPDIEGKAKLELIQTSSGEIVWQFSSDQTAESIDREVK